MGFGIVNFVEILGALALFIFGMKMMSEGVQRAAGSQLRNILRAMTRNKYLGVFTGFIVTALVQSSSATTVMTVSFVNAGLVTVIESAGIMMGANVGTTITAWIISTIGLEINLSAISIPLLAIGVPLLFFKRGSLMYWGEFLVGFSLLFLGLYHLDLAIPIIETNSPLFTKLQNLVDYGFASRVLFVVIGAIITILVQSSTAAMAITLTLCYKGWLPLDIGAAMVLGENIGTTITAEIASLVGNVSSKRSARIHSIFNIIGVIWMIIFLPYILNYVSNFIEWSFTFFDNSLTSAQGLSVDNKKITFTLAAFHTIFNVLNVIFLIGFVKYLVKAAIWSVPNKDGDKKDTTKLKFISTRISTPELATIELMKETLHFGDIVYQMSQYCSTLINATENSDREKMYRKIKKYEKITDRMEIEITEYVTKLSSQEITGRTSQRLRSILNICNDLERIGDIYYQISKTVKQKNKDRRYFLPMQRNGLNDMMQLLDDGFVEMLNNLGIDDYNKVSLEVSINIEKKINKLRDKLRSENLTQLGTEGYDVQSAMIYNNIFSGLEKVGDHIINVSEAVKGEI